MKTRKLNEADFWIRPSLSQKQRFYIWGFIQENATLSSKGGRAVLAKKNSSAHSFFGVVVYL